MARTYKERITERIIEREVVEEYVDVRLPSKSKFHNGNFITVFQNALGFISTELELSKGALQLLIYLISKTELTNEIKLPVVSIAEALKTSRGNAYNFLNELKKHNIIVWEQKLKTLRLNYELGYKGKIKDYKKFQYKDEPILLQAPKNQLSLLDPVSVNEEVSISKPKKKKA
jgi:hypothetical protein